MDLRIYQVHGELTVFMVESHSLECLNTSGCGKLFSRHKYPALSVGDRCPKCNGLLDVRFHRVDLALYSGNGQCACEHFMFNLEPKVSRVPPGAQKRGLWRCEHIRAARDYALDLTLRCHEKERLKNGNGRKEESYA